MATTERRIAALEASAYDGGIKLVMQADGETQAEALKRAGLMPGTLRVVWLTPLDMSL